MDEDRGTHKYARGHLTILAGAVATGAASLAALAGRRVGAGLVTIDVIESTLAVFQAAEPGNLWPKSTMARCSRICWTMTGAMPLLIGPGSGLNERTRDCVVAALATGRPVVLDADAITVFAANPAMLFAASEGRTCSRRMRESFAGSFPISVDSSDKLGG